MNYKDIADKWHGIEHKIPKTTLTPELAVILGFARDDVLALANVITDMGEDIRHLQATVRQLTDELEARLPAGERLAEIVARWQTQDHPHWERMLEDSDVVEQADRDLSFLLGELEKRADTDREAGAQRVLVWSEPAV